MGKVVLDKRAITAHVGRHSRSKVAEALRIVADKARELVSTPGRSLPGQPPGYDTGELYESINVDMSADGARGSVVATAPHAEPLEFGSPTMAPRPFMRPAMILCRDAIRALMGRG